MTGGIHHTLGSDTSDEMELRKKLKRGGGIGGGGGGSIDKRKHASELQLLRNASGHLTADCQHLVSHISFLISLLLLYNVAHI